MSRLNSAVLVLCLSFAASAAEDKWVFAIRYFQSDRDVAEVSNVVVRAAKAGYTGLALVSGRDYTGNWWDADRPDDRTPEFRAAHAALDSWWVMSPDRQRRVKEVAWICAANGLELVPFMWSVGYNSMRFAEPEVAASDACEAREVEPLVEPLDLDGEFGGKSESRSLATTAAVEPNGLYEIRGEVRTEHLHWSEFGGYGCGARCIVSDPEDNGDMLAFVSAKGKATRGWTPFSLTFASGRHRLVKVEVGRWWDNSGSCAFRKLTLQQVFCDDWVTRGGETMTRKWFADRQSSACMSDERLYAYFKKSAATVQKEFAPKKWFLSMDEIRVDCECAACRKAPFSERLGRCLRAQYDAIKAVCPGARVYVWSDMVDPGHNCRSGDPLAALPKDVVVAIWDARRPEEAIGYFAGRGYRVMGAGYYDLKDAKSVRENYATWKRLLDASGKSAGIMYTTWAGFRGCTEGDYRFLEEFCSTAAVDVAAAPAKDLLARMTLEEKVGQLVQLGSAGYASDDQSKVAISDGLRKAIREGRVGTLIGACGIAKFNELQRIAKEESRLGIPLMVGHDIIHGCRTVLPIPLGLSCAWDEDLWRRGAEMMAVEALSRGCNWTFNPMLDISRDARWGRSAESPGQDPFLAARYAAAMVRGYQGEDPADGRHIAACLKHYLAYGACEGGRDYNTVELSDDTLRNVYLPPFAAGVAAGAMTVMPGFHAINGVPCSANRHLLTDVLRGELGFAGFTVSDYNAIGELASGHAVAESPAAAAVLAIGAGMDVDMMSGCFRDGLVGQVRCGRVSEAAIDEAVRRILSVKARLGLFERPYVAADLLGRIDLARHRALARESAAKSVVLVKNERQVLPLAKGCRVLLLGSMSDDRNEMLGCWQLWKEGFENATVREGLVADGTSVEFASAYTPTGRVDRAAIRAAAARADVVIASFGESCWDYASMNGENCSRAEIGLPGRQLEAVEEIKSSGKPFVALLFCGRPLAVPELMAAADAVVVAWNPGSSGGWGVADVLTGVQEPYGRLTVDFPHKTGECPLYYNRLPTGRPWKPNGEWVTKYIDAPSPGRSLLPFGHGLTYTTFRYSNESVATDGSNVVFTATVANAGARPGSEVVQAYVRDLVAEVSRPRRELKGFVRVPLKPGESRQVRIVVPRDEFGFWHCGRRVAGTGEFAAWIAPDSDSGRELRIRLEDRFGGAR